MTVSRNPELWQSLPAEKQQEVEGTPELVGIEEELENLLMSTDPADKDRRKTLKAQKRKLVADPLRDYQKIQLNKTLSKESGNDQKGRHRTIFSRVRHLMPERDRLASNLFCVAPIRSNEGRKFLRDMIAIPAADRGCIWSGLGAR